MLLLDTHALLWMMRGEFRTQAAVSAVSAAQDADTLYVSAITAWKLGAAGLKRTNRPELGMAPGIWFRQALRTTGAKLATITRPSQPKPHRFPPSTAAATPATAS